MANGVAGNLKPTFQGEVQLVGWSDTHTRGPIIALRLSDSEELEVFKGMTVRKGGVAGQRLACVLVEIGDDEKPVHQQPQAAAADAEPADAPESLAHYLHRTGYFRSYALWLAMHDAGIYTMQQHKVWLGAQQCEVRGLLAGPCAHCSGEVVVHHAHAASIPDAGARQPEAPQKPSHFYGIPLCHGHHSNWAHGVATRSEKTQMLVWAVKITAERVKSVIKNTLGIESLTELTRDMLEEFERNINLDRYKHTELK